MIEIIRASIRLFLALQRIVLDAVLVAPLMFIFDRDQFFLEWREFVKELKR